MTVIQPNSESLPEIGRRIWQQKQHLLYGAVIGLCFSIFLIFTLKPHFQASMIVAPPSRDSRTNSFIEGTLVYAPEIEARIPTGSPEFIRFEQSLRGVAVANILFRMGGIVEDIKKDSIWRGQKGSINSPEELSEYLAKKIKIDTIGATSNRRIIYHHPDPAFAAKLLTILRKADDQIIRTSVKTETETKIDWLKSELTKTLNPDHRKAIAQLLLSEERRRMLLSLETPYAVNVVEEASSLPKPVIPNKFFIVFMLLGAGLGMGALIAYLKSDKR